MAHTNIKPSQSKLIHSKDPVYANQNDLLAMQNRIKGDQEHLQAIFDTGKLYGPMDRAAQVKAVEYAYGIRGVIKKK
jgi:hypothetical protein